MNVIFNRLQRRKKLKNSVNELEQLVSHEYEKMYRIAFSYTHHHDDALDLIQTSFNKVLLSLQKNNNIQNIQGWYYRILINTCKDAWRKKQHEPTSVDISVEKVTQSNSIVTRMELNEIISKLDSPEKEIIVLKFFEGFTLEETAIILDMNVNTVKTKMYRALNHLREILENKEGTL
ncbi:RNA polymerase sigma factor [Lactobacillus sp. UCMA15818]|uniref:RNA polymerase sigma factor n=1 Tax=Lactobacillaceae TaxID=33958 RepID=UPI0025B0CEC6|nr:RNA polymerase sigma factor [Lactobacillus sp. UCMA15818]MDN2453685.1 RNA polymerase sigma factor [Lactobacillus sp. UCMA15818]